VNNIETYIYGSQWTHLERAVKDAIDLGITPEEFVRLTERAWMTALTDQRKAAENAFKKINEKG